MAPNAEPSASITCTKPGCEKHKDNAGIQKLLAGIAGAKTIGVFKNSNQLACHLGNEHPEEPFAEVKAKVDARDPAALTELGVYAEHLDAQDIGLYTHIQYPHRPRVDKKGVPLLAADPAVVDSFMANHQHLVVCWSCWKGDIDDKATKSKAANPVRPFLSTGSSEKERSTLVVFYDSSEGPEQHKRGFKSIAKLFHPLQPPSTSFTLRDVTAAWRAESDATFKAPEGELAAEFLEAEKVKHFHAYLLTKPAPLVSLPLLVCPICSSRLTVHAHCPGVHRKEGR
jgi:hypothetical protein